MSTFTETVIWTDPTAAAYGQLRSLTHKPARAAGSHSLRSVTAWVDEDEQTYLTRHLYLSDHHDRHSSIPTLRLRYFENRKYHDGRPHQALTANDDLTDPVHAAMLLAYGNPNLAVQVVAALAAAIPAKLLTYLPVDQLDAIQQLLIVRFPLLRHLAEQNTAIPHRVPDRFVGLFEQRTVRDVLAQLVGTDAISRPAAAQLARLLIHDNQVRTREATMLVAARGLPRDTSTELLRHATPTGDATDLVEFAHGLAASRILGRLGPDRHRQALHELLAREDGAQQLTNIAQHGHLPLDGIRTLDQLLERARRRGPYGRLDGLEVPGTDRRLRVIYPGEDAELTQLGTQMRNCIRQYTTDGAMTFTHGAIIAVVDARGRAHHAIQIDGLGRVQVWEGVDSSPPPAADRDQIAQLLQAHNIRVPDPRRLNNDEVPF